MRGVPFIGIEPTLQELQASVDACIGVCVAFSPSWWMTVEGHYEEKYHVHRSQQRWAEVSVAECTATADVRFLGHNADQALQALERSIQVEVNRRITNKLADDHDIINAEATRHQNAKVAAAKLAQARSIEARIALAMSHQSAYSALSHQSSVPSERVLVSALPGCAKVYTWE